VATSEAREILENIKRKPPKLSEKRPISWHCNGPIRSRGCKDVGTQVEMTTATTSIGNSQTDHIDYQFVPTNEWGGQTVLPWHDSSREMTSSRHEDQSVHVTSTEIQTVHDEFLNLGSNVRDSHLSVFTTESKPVEIQTDPITTNIGMNDMNLQTDFTDLDAWNDFQVEFDSAGTQTDFSLENLNLNLIQR